MARARVSRNAWIDAALVAMARGGATALAIDPLATGLGISRGSFYWHFTDRDDLLRAVLERWEKEGTENVVAGLSAIDDPAERLLALFRAAVDDEEHLEGFEVALAAEASHPIVGPVVARVTERRLAALAELFRELGFEAGAARQRAVMAYALYVGWINLRHCSRDQVPEVGTAIRDGDRGTLAEAVRLLLTPLA